MPWAKSFWAFSPYLNHMRNFSYFITCCYVRNVGTKILLFLHLYEPKPKWIVSEKEYKSTPEWLLIKKNAFWEKRPTKPTYRQEKTTKQKKNKGKYKNKCQNIWWNKIKAVPLQSLLKSKGGYQSGQMGQTVNLLAMPSVVRIHHHPLFPNITRDKRVRISYEIWIFFVYTSLIPNQH